MAFGLNAPTAEGPTIPRAFAAARRNASAAIASVKTTCVLWPRSGSNLLANADASVAGPLSPNGGMVDVSAAQRSSVPMDALARRGGMPPKKTVKIGSGIRHPLGRFCTPKRSKSARQMRTKSKLAKIIFHHHLWLGKAREHSPRRVSCSAPTSRPLVSSLKVPSAQMKMTSRSKRPARHMPRRAQRGVFWRPN